MNAVVVQRDLVSILKKESHLNFELLNRLQPMSASLSKQVFKENALEKLNKNLFHHLSQYLVCIVDPQVGANLPWPIYDTAMEKGHRNKLASFISDYSSKGLLSPVMSSYLVNPACYKVTLFISELSQLAVQKILQTRIKQSQKESYENITNKYKSENKDFINDIEKETDRVSSKISCYLHKRKAFEKIAEMMRNRIKGMDETLSKLNAQKYINDIVDGFINTHTLDEETKSEVLKIKNVHEQSKILDCWLKEVDKEVTQLETTWDAKVTPFLETCRATKRDTEILIARHYGRADKSTYMLEYEHKNDFICTKDLQNEVNSQQKYILMNIVRDEKLNFPNLIRGFLVAISYVMKGAQTGNIYKFNEALEDGMRRYKELVADMKIVLEKVDKVNAKLEPSPPVTFQQLAQISHYYEIPPLPDLTDLKMASQQSYDIFDTFTPLSMSKQCHIQFNLRRQNSSYCSFPKPPKPGPYSQGIRHDFLKTLISSSTYEHHNVTQISHNMSIMSQVSKVNETVCGASSGFTKDQIQRLLSSKKTSITKKLKNRKDRGLVTVKKTCLFNESSSVPNRSLYRSISSPNLVETKGTRKRLSIVRDDSLPSLELSGIMAIDSEMSCETPERMQQENFKKSNDAGSLPAINISKCEMNGMYEDYKVDLENSNNSSIQEIKVATPRMQRNIDLDKSINEISRKDCESKLETPKMQNNHSVQKSNSLEKIINRYKLVRANIVAARSEDIAEENMNSSTVNLGLSPADKARLPDLVSPGYNGHLKKLDRLDDFFDIEDRSSRMPRASLGTVLGVDETFLDQFDLID